MTHQSTRTDFSIALLDLPKDFSILVFFFLRAILLTLLGKRLSRGGLETIPCLGGSCSGASVRDEFAHDHD